MPAPSSSCRCPWPARRTTSASTRTARGTARRAPRSTTRPTPTTARRSRRRVSGPRPVPPPYRPWSTRGTPYPTDDDQLVVDTGSLFAGQDQVDKSADYVGGQDYGAGYNGSSSADCQYTVSPPGVYHNQWYRLAT